jgi:lipoprotein-releasing system permease protein
MVEAEALAQGPDNVTGAVVRGVTPSDLKSIKIVSGNIKQGSLDGFGAGDYGGDLVLLGNRLANQLGVQAGDQVTLVSPNGAATAFGSLQSEKKTYTVGAIFSVGMSEYDQTYVYMPLPQAQLFFGLDQSITVIQVMLRDPDQINVIKPQIEAAAGPAAIVTDWREKNQSFFNALNVERSTMRLILLLIVAIAAANIISGLVMLVKNKGRDIAILRTMGASRGAILRIFFMAGATVGALGTLAGFVLGVLFCTYIEQIQKFVEWATGSDVFNADVYFLEKIPAKMDWSEVAFITGLSLVMSFLATLPPAWRASRLDPVEALRYE